MAFEIALEGCASEGIITAAKDFIAGKVKRTSNAFAPSTAEFVAHVRTVPLSKQSQADFIRQRQNEIGAVPAKQIAAPKKMGIEALAPEARERVKAKMADYVAANYRTKEDITMSRANEIFEEANRRSDKAHGVKGYAPTHITAAEVAAIPDRVPGVPYGFKRASA